MIFAIDFDGTIVENKYPMMGKEIPLAIEVMRKLQNAGHKIIIWTCREEATARDMVNWMMARNFYPDAVNTNVAKDLDGISAKRKVYADVYIDDRSFPPFEGNWLTVAEKFLKQE